MPVIAALRRLRQEDLKFKARQGDPASKEKIGEGTKEKENKNQLAI
jgi:hypothetical protein